MGHGIWFSAQVEQRASHATSNIKKCQITDLAGGISQALDDLLADGKQEFRVFVAQLNKFAVADFTDFTFSFSTNPGAAMLLVKKTHFTDKVAGIKVGENHFLAVAIVFNNDGHGSFDYIVEGVTLISRVNNGAFSRVATAVAMG
jgi:hypothetical protein